MTPSLNSTIGLCQCGCGQQASLATKTNSRSGSIKGQPVKYVVGHSMRGRSWNDSQLKHGHRTATSTFSVWRSMIKRCADPTCDAYKWYGGRGIKVCERWQIFAGFLSDMGERPVGKSIDRYPNQDGNYEPANCRWATQKEQIRNSSIVRFLTVGGVTKTYTEWEESLGLCRGIVSYRIKHGWSAEECIQETDKRFGPRRKP